MGTGIKTPDEIMKENIEARAKEVALLQKSRVEGLEYVNARRQKRIAAIKKILPNDMLAFLNNLEKENKEAAKEIINHMEEVRKTMRLTMSSIGIRQLNHPGPASGGGGKLTLANTYKICPSVSVLHMEPGVLYDASGKSPNPDGGGSLYGFEIVAQGTSSGFMTVPNADSNRISVTQYVDWYFDFTPQEAGFYTYQVSVPVVGIYRLDSLDGYDPSTINSPPYSYGPESAAASVKLSVSTNVPNMSLPSITNWAAQSTDQDIEVLLGNGGIMNQAVSVQLENSITAESPGSLGSIYSQELLMVTGAFNVTAIAEYSYAAFLTAIEIPTLTVQWFTIT